MSESYASDSNAESQLLNENGSEKTLKLAFSENNDDDLHRDDSIYMYQYKNDKRKFNIPQLQDSLIKTLPKDTLGYYSESQEDMSTQRLNQMDPNNCNLSRDRGSMNNSSKPRTLNKLADYSKESSNQDVRTDVRTLNMGRNRENKRNYYINRDLNSTGYRTRPVSKDSRRNQTYYKRTSPSVDNDRDKLRTKDGFFINNDSLGASSMKNSLPWMTHQSKPTQSFRTSVRSRPSKNNSKDYLMKEKVSRLENLNKGYRVLLMSMSMTKDAIKKNHTPTNMQFGPTSPTEKNCSVKDEKMIERSYSVQGDNHHNNKEKDINQKISILKKRQRNFENLSNKLQKLVYENFLQICSLNRPQQKSENALNKTKGMMKSGTYSSKKAVSDQVNLTENNINLDFNFGAYTIAKILDNRDLQIEISSRNSEKCMTPEDAEIKKKKEFIGCIVKSIHSEMGIPYSIGQQNSKIWDQF